MIPNAALAQWARRMANLCNGSIPVPDALAIVAKYTEDAGLRVALEAAHALMSERGSKFTDALREFPKVFDAGAIQLLSYGDLVDGNSSDLDEVFRILADLLERPVERDRRLRERVGDGIADDIANFRRHALAHAQNPQELDAISLALPTLGRYTAAVETAQFCQALGSLFALGVPILDALDLTVAFLREPLFIAMAQRVQDDIANGGSLAPSIEAHDGMQRFDRSVIAEIGFSEQSGDIAAGLLRAAAHADRVAHDLLRR